MSKSDVNRLIWWDYANYSASYSASRRTQHLNTKILSLPFLPFSSSLISPLLSFPLSSSLSPPSHLFREERELNKCTYCHFFNHNILRLLVTAPSAPLSYFWTSAVILPPESKLLVHATPTMREVKICKQVAKQTLPHRYSPSWAKLYVNWSGTLQNYGKQFTLS